MHEVTPSQPGANLATVVRGEQRQHWQRGERVRVEELLHRYPDLHHDTEGLLDLIYSEVVLREQAGEAPRLDEYTARFPQWTTELRMQFDVHNALDQPSAGLGGVTPRFPAASEDAPSNQTVAGPSPPGYKILSELGRGGMGVVWKARHLRLNRLVALKMIRRGLGARTEELTRFHAEAAAVAKLSHPHIVQIYEVGDHDGGPYLSLEYVNGPSLAQRLADAPLPPRAAAVLLETLARAVEHAHQHGIVHRDLKPANVLLTPDDAPKITDFGLAKRLDLDSGQTQSGMLIGTPSYMAPEQAAGQDRPRPDAVGPPADVYALGAVLYECLTGRPPFRGVTPLDTLLLVRMQDPVPPAQLQPKCPRDLEIICLKCLEKAPPKRYARAVDLADDLRRFLNGEPIHARPTPWWERAWKWARRRPAAAAALLAGFLLLVVLVGFTVALRRALDRVESNFERAFQAVEDSFVTVTENRKFRQYDLLPEFHGLLQTAERYYLDFVNERGDDPRLRAKQAKAYRRLAQIGAEIGDPAKALDYVQQSVAILRSLTTMYAGHDYQTDLAASLDLEGVLCRQLGKYPESLAAHEESLALRQRLVDADPESADKKGALAQSWSNLGMIQYHRHAWTEAKKAHDFARALCQQLADQQDLPERQGALAQCWNDLGLLYRKQDMPKEAAAAYQNAFAIREKLVKASPKEPDYRFAFARSVNNLAGVYRQAKEWTKADESFRQAIAAMEKLHESHPSMLEYRDYQALFHYNRALLWHQQDAQTRDLNQARALYQKALELWAGIPEIYQVPQTKRRIAQCYYEWGSCELLAKQSKEALSKFATAVARFQAVPPVRLTEEEMLVQDEEGRLKRARLCHQQGHAHSLQEEWGQAAPFYREAVELWPATAISSAKEQHELASIHARLSECSEHLGLWDDALLHAEKTRALCQYFSDGDDQRLMREFARAVQALAWMHQGETVKARAAAEALKREEPQWQRVSYRLARIYALLAAESSASAAQRQEDTDEALRLLKHAAVHFKKPAHVQKAENEPDLRALHFQSDFQSWLETVRKATTPRP